jgi:hypothetical protein
MNLQYISDSMGKITGVFIPIAEWNELKNKYKGIEQERIDIPLWQQDEVRRRMAGHLRNPGQAQDFDAEMDAIEKEL